MIEDVSVASRFSQLLSASSLEAKDLAERLGIKPVSVKNLLSGRNYPSHETYVKLKEVFPNLNFYWLIFGTGDMWLKEEGQAGVKESTQPPTPPKETKKERPTLLYPASESERKKQTNVSVQTRGDAEDSEKAISARQEEEGVKVRTSESEKKSGEEAIGNDAEKEQRIKTNVLYADAAPRPPDIIVLQPDGRYIRYRAIEE